MRPFFQCAVSQPQESKTTTQISFSTVFVKILALCKKKSQNQDKRTPNKHTLYCEMSMTRACIFQIQGENSPQLDNGDKIPNMQAISCTNTWTVGLKNTHTLVN